MKQYGHFILFIWLPLILFIYLTPTHSFMIPRLSPIREQTLVSTNTKDHIKTFYYKQTLDHFNYLPQSYKTFLQRYIINFKYWGGSNSTAPIFVNFGGEYTIDYDPDSGIMIENAATFKALLVYIEHRYYGKSIPFQSREEAFKNARTLGYFNSAQALADYANVIIHIKKTLKAQNSPVVVVGGSYSGMLATWFRLKYPHLAIGALASSAPILSINDIIQTPNAFMDVVSRDYKEVSETCFKTIRNSWDEIDKVASQSNGLSILSKRFNACSPLKHSVELSNFLETFYVFAAQFNDPPAYPVTRICNGIDGASFGNDTLDKIYSGVVAFYGNFTCQLIPNSTYIDETSESWGWQTCSEMVILFGKGNDSMFQPSSFNLKKYVKECKKKYGVSPRQHWISTYYGSQNIKLVLKRFGSNIILSNGLKDPFSSGGVLKDISKSIIAITTTNGSHILDLRSSQENDPDWLIAQRKKEIKIIQKWIKQYYTDLVHFVE